MQVAGNVGHGEGARDVFYCQDVGSRPEMFSFCCGIAGAFKCNPALESNSRIHALLLSHTVHFSRKRMSLLSCTTNEKELLWNECVAYVKT